MTALVSEGPYGVLTEPATLRIERVLPGPIERVWSYLTESDLRRKWLASGTMELRIGAPFEFVWRNDELTDPPGERPPGFSGEHRMESKITELNPPRKISFAWKDSGDVSIELKPEGGNVRLTLIHRRLPQRSALIAVSTGWHMHLDLLVARMKGEGVEPFWNGWKRVRAEYDRRLPA